jgi:hypothetical protein
VCAGSISLIAGSSSDYSGSVDGVGSSAKFQSCSDISIFNGTIFVLDETDNKIRKISSGLLHFIFLSIFFYYFGFKSLCSGNVVSTLAGSGSSSSTDGVGTDATFNSPNGIAVDTFGNVFVADSNKVRRVTTSG